MNDNLPLLHFVSAPGSAVESIIDILGIEFMRKLATKLSGLEIKMPAAVNLHPDHKLVVALGLEDAARLCGVVKGELLSIPHGRTPYYLKRREYFTRAVNEGKPIADMAKELGVTMRQVRRVLGEMGLRGRHCAVRNPGVSEAVWRERDRLIGKCEAGTMTKREAAKILGCDVEDMRGWERTFRKKGTCIPKRFTSPQSANDAAAASNGGLTGRREVSGVPAAREAKTLASAV